jgi:hypothetical protein
MRQAAETALAQSQTALALRSGVVATAAAAADFNNADGGACRGLVGLLPGGGAWDAVRIEEGFGLEVSSRLKWRQTQTHGAFCVPCKNAARLTTPTANRRPTAHPTAVEVFVRLPEPLALQHAAGRSIKTKVAVTITPATLRVALGGGGADVAVAGALFARVKAEASTWFIGERIKLLSPPPPVESRIAQPPSSHHDPTTQSTIHPFPKPIKTTEWSRSSCSSTRAAATTRPAPPTPTPGGARCWPAPPRGRRWRGATRRQRTTLRGLRRVREEEDG